MRVYEELALHCNFPNHKLGPIIPICDFADLILGGWVTGLRVLAGEREQELNEVLLQV